MGKNRNGSDLIDLFEQRGMIVENKERAVELLKYVNYYKLKELAYPFNINTEINKDPIYEGITFKSLLTRYYQDKRIRIELMACIENIEIAFKTRFSYHLGEKFGDLGYYHFKNWCNKEEYCKHYISDKQSEFKKTLKENEYLIQSLALKEHFAKNGIDMKYDKIPIWHYVEFATFGEILFLYKLMSNTLREKISNDFMCTPSEIESWLGNLKLLRNKIAHNSNIIDIKFTTKPGLKPNWKTYIDHNQQGIQAGRLAESILIVVHFTQSLNKNYQFNELQGCINNLVNQEDSNAKKLGFANVEASKCAIRDLGGYISPNYSMNKRTKRRRKKQNFKSI